jgi:hypothetical protein
MSFYLRKLEEIESPSETAIRATRIPKVLKEINKLGEIPREGKFHIKEQAVSLLERWNTTLNLKEQPNVTRTTQRQSANVSKPLVVDLTEDSALESSPEPTSDHTNKPSICLSPLSKSLFHFMQLYLTD